MVANNRIKYYKNEYIEYFKNKLLENKYVHNLKIKLLTSEVLPFNKDNYNKVSDTVFNYIVSIVKKGGEIISKKYKYLVKGNSKRDYEDAFINFYNYNGDVSNYRYVDFYNDEVLISLRYTVIDLNSVLDYIETITTNQDYNNIYILSYSMKYKMDIFNMNEFKLQVVFE